MAVEEFQFKIAKAKDLPLSWFELVLCPDKFREHLKTLETNPDGREGGGGHGWSFVQWIRGLCEYYSSVVS